MLSSLCTILKTGSFFKAPAIIAVITMIAMLSQTQNVLCLDVQFLVVDKSSYLDEYIPFRDNVLNNNKQAILQAIDAMLESLDAYGDAAIRLTPYFLEQRKHSYDEYFIKLISAYQAAMKTSLSAIRGAVINSTISSADIDKLLNSFFHWKCTFFYKENWFCYPTIAFSIQFFSYIEKLERQYNCELLYFWGMPQMDPLAYNSPSPELYGLIDEKVAGEILARVPHGAFESAGVGVAGVETQVGAELSKFYGLLQGAVEGKYLIYVWYSN